MKKEDLLKVTIANSVIVSAFPGTGKTSYCYRDADYMPEGFASDSDSSKFDKTKFPANYISHIQQKISEGYARIFVSSHKEVRNALVANCLPFVLIYPKKELKSEYIERYKQRGNNEKFIELLSANWDEWIDECRNQESCFKIELGSNEFLSYVI